MTSHETAARRLPDAERRLRAGLQQMHVAARRTTSDKEFEQVWFRLLTELLAVEAGTFWRKAGDRWLADDLEGQASENIIGLALDEDRRRRSVAEAALTNRPQSTVLSAVEADALSTSPLTWLCFPIFLFGEVSRVVELYIATENAALSEACAKTIAVAAEALEIRELLRQRGEFERFRESRLEERRIIDAFFAQIDLLPTAAVVANETRRVVQCDRATVVLRRGVRCRVLAVSGQDDFDRRSGAVLSIERLAEQACRIGRVLNFPGTTACDSHDFAEACDQHVERNDVKRLKAVPLQRDIVATDGESKYDDGPFAVLILEWFGSPVDEAAVNDALTMIVGPATRALDGAERHDEIFLLPLWRMVGRLRRAWSRPGTRRRAIATLAFVGVLVAVVCVVPADFTVYCTGTLEPAVKRSLYAPADAIVREIHCGHGDHVAKGQLLVELRSSELEIAIARTTGDRTAAVEQLASIGRALIDEPRQTEGERRARLSGQRTELRKRIAALDRQLELYGDQLLSLQVLSPIDGEITTWNMELLRNRPVRQGQLLLGVARLDGLWELQLQVPDARSGRVTEAARITPQPLQVTYHPISDPGETRQATLSAIQNSVEVRGEAGSTLLMTASPDGDSQLPARPGSAVVAHIHCGRRALGYVWSRDVIDFVRSRILFRWF